jgi:predicted metal-dependent phosphoesterase TrpH
MMIIDMHVHTNPLSPCSNLSPEEAILEAKLKGLDGICFTEHDVMWDNKRIAYLREKHDFLVFKGIEITTNYGHILVYGLNSWDKDRYWS